MADISTGRQRGIVPFVDETTGRLPDQYLPQGVIDLQGDLEQAVTDAGASATAAKASADTATQSASAAAQSAESASGDATAAKASAGEAASSAGAAKASETAAASSATAAEESKTAAKASETAAAQSAQTATAQVSSIGDSVEQASASAAAAQQSATNAASSASNASQSASSASTSASQAGESASQANGFASTASHAATTATGAASNASASAAAAQQSASDASASASAAKASETTAAGSASVAKASETNAAASATAAQQAVEGFGLEVGTTTTGEPGTDASVNITKQGTKYVADFTIPRGPKGDPGDLTTVTHDDTLTGDGTTGAPLGVVAGTAIKPVDKAWDSIDLNDYYTNGIYTFNCVLINGPTGQWTSGGFMVLRSKQGVTQLVFCNPAGSLTRMAVRGAKTDTDAPPSAEDWSAWEQVASLSDIPDVSALTSRIATLQAGLDELAVMQTRLQALEIRVKSLETNQ